MRPQDVVVAARLALDPGGTWSYERLASELGMSSQTVHASVQRLASSRLFNVVRRRIARQEFLEFVEHGVRFAFPAHRGSHPVRGLPTGSSGPPLASKLPAGEDASLVWPDKRGQAVGTGLVPLHRSAPGYAKSNPRLYDILTLIDAVRVGGAREREVASVELRKRLS